MTVGEMVTKAKIAPKKVYVYGYDDYKDCMDKEVGTWYSEHGDLIIKLEEK